MSEKLSYSTATKVLKDSFGYDSFRFGQEEIIKAILQGDNTLAVMPTGAGKSICYQIPALIMPGTCIVVSPLIALMQDQVGALKSKGIAAEYISSMQDQESLRQIYSEVSRGNIKLLYISPERLKNEWFRDFIQDLDISFIAIDEAHCISEWGHDFRPSYRLIGQHLREGKDGSYQIAAFTATATPKVREDVTDVLHLEKARVFIRGFDRPNLSYRTELPKETKKKRILQLIGSIYDNPKDDGSAIVYCGSRKRVEEISAYLRENDRPALIYHAGLTDKLREMNQEKFINGDGRVIVATNAFGMGVDKPDVRMVIHHDLTSTMESYYQEAGRAGRDGKPAKCILLYKNGDERLQQFFIDCANPEKEAIQQVWRELQHAHQEGTPLPKSEHLAAKLDLKTMKASSIYSLFEKHDLIISGRDSTRATLQFEVTIEDLRQLDRDLSERRQKECLRAIVRSVPPSSLNKPCEIDIRMIAGKADLPTPQIKAFLGYLSTNGYANIKYASSRETKILNPAFADERTPPIDYDKMDSLKSRSLWMLGKVSDYVHTAKCKRNYILEYFGDKGEGECGQCSHCLGDSPKSVSFTDKHRLIVLEAVKSLRERYGRRLLMQFLRGDKEGKIQELGLYGLNRYGALSDFTNREIYSLIDSMVNDGQLIRTSDKYPIMKLGPEAKKSLRGADINADDYGNGYLDSTPAIQRSNRISWERSTNPKRDLYLTILKELSNTVARREGVAASAFVSQALATKLSVVRPLGLHELESMGAMSNPLVSKYRYSLLNISELSKQHAGSGENADTAPNYSELYTRLEEILRQEPDISLRRIRAEHELYFPYSTMKAALADMKGIIA